MSHSLKADGKKYLGEKEFVEKIFIMLHTVYLQGKRKQNLVVVSVHLLII